MLCSIVGNSWALSALSLLFTANIATLVLQVSVGCVPQLRSTWHKSYSSIFCKISCTNQNLLADSDITWRADSNNLVPCCVRWLKGLLVKALLLFDLSILPEYRKISQKPPAFCKHQRRNSCCCFSSRPSWPFYSLCLSKDNGELRWKGLAPMRLSKSATILTLNQST